MLHFRPVRLPADKNILLELHCEINYASDSPWARTVPYEQYRRKWLSTPQPEQFIAHLAETMNDRRTIAEIIEDGNHKIVGYIWVVFNDVPDYGLTIAEIMDFVVCPEYRGKGLGLQLLTYIEDKAIGYGANLLRSETGVENMPSQNLHRRFGFETYRVLFEKRLEARGPVRDFPNTRDKMDEKTS